MQSLSLATVLIVLTTYYAYWWLAMPHSLRCSPLRETTPGDWMSTVHVRPTVLPALLCALLGETEELRDAQSGAPLTITWRHAINSEAGALSLKLPNETALVELVRECRYVRFQQRCLMTVARTMQVYVQDGDAQCRDDSAFDVLPMTLLLLGGGAAFLLCLALLACGIILCAAGAVCACVEKYWPPPPVVV